MTVRPETLYWQRFSIAERFGREEIQAVYNEIFKEAKTDYKHLTELVMILNHKSWQYCYELDNSTVCGLYRDLFKQAYEYASEHLEGDEMKYFMQITD